MGIILIIKLMGLIRFISKAFKRDKNHLVIRKSDDELTRYLK